MSFFMTNLNQTTDATAFMLSFQAIVTQAVKTALSEQVKAEPREEAVRAPATRQEACEFLKLSLPTLDTLIRTGRLKSYKIGRQVRINWSDLDSYVMKGA